MGNFVVSARKYRPRHFGEVIGQGHVVGTLGNALRTDQLAHAFLFCGPRGVGKTTCARILARTINCSNLQNGIDPCGECSSCKSFDQNASFNIIELDAASHNSVEHIRALNEQVRFRPQQGDYKVYIIDEVHMLSMQAFNAFLKTLEEPPPHAIFILATTEKHKIIPTILSRCQIFDFKRIQVKDMVTHLEEICKAEGIAAEREALITIAQKSDGALRDALSLFDRLAGVAEKQLTYQKVIQNLNLLDFDVFFRTADACLREDVREVLLIFDEVQKNGFEGDAFLGGLAAHYRDLLVCSDEKTLALQDYSDALKERYKQQGQLMAASYIFSALNLINTADLQYPMARNKRLHVEMALAKICFVHRLTSGNAVVEEKKTSDPGESQSSSSPVKSTVTNEATKPPAPTTKTAVDPAPAKQPVQIPTVPKLPDHSEDDNSSIQAEADVMVAPVQVMTPVKLKATKVSNGGTAVVNTPRLDSLNSITSHVVAQEKEARANSLELTQENLEQWWTSYQENIESPSVQTTFKQASLSLDDNKVVIEVGSPLARARIHEELSLISELRDKFHNPRLEVDIRIDPTKAEIEPAKPKKLLTNKEKYELLCGKNPLMRDLKDSLDLIVDHDD